MGVDEGYVPTEVVDGDEDVTRPPTHRQGDRGPEGVSGVSEQLGGTSNSERVGGSGDPIGPPSGGFVGVGSSDGTSNSVGPVDRGDPWSGASTASVARAVEVVTNCMGST
eukprot:1530257-Amphidinium_carterae.2